MKKYTLSAVFLMLSLLLLLSSLLSSCAWLIPGYAERIKPNESDLEHACCAYAIPGMFINETPRMWIVETDAQGRKLIKYKMFNEITRLMTNAYVICQKTTKNKAFFYEDVCYLFEPRNEMPENDESGKDGTDDYVDDFETVSVSEEDMVAFKAQNDWNMPLNEEKMSYREVVSVSAWGPRSITTSQRYYSRDLKRAISYAMGTDVGGILFQDKDERGHEIHYFDMEDGRQYLVMVSHDENAYDMIRLAFFEIENGELDREAYAAFKKANGWVYGP